MTARDHARRGTKTVTIYSIPEQLEAFHDLAPTRTESFWELARVIWGAKVPDLTGMPVLLSFVVTDDPELLRRVVETR